MLDNKVVLITGAAHRIGATTARTLHADGMNLILHYRSSDEASKALRDELLAQRPDSVLILKADLHETKALPELIKTAAAKWGQLGL